MEQYPYENEHAETLSFIKPCVDDKKKEQIMHSLLKSFGLRICAKFDLYHEYEECAAIGIVDKVDPYTRTFLIDGEQFYIEDIINASIYELELK